MQAMDARCKPPGLSSSTFVALADLLVPPVPLERCEHMYIHPRFALRQRLSVVSRYHSQHGRRLQLELGVSQDILLI
jgi:hypothetical protein